jgi:hypothetical protein
LESGIRLTYGSWADPAADAVDQHCVVRPAASAAARANASACLYTQVRGHWAGTVILCKDRNRVVAEYALRGVTKPIGVSRYELVAALPEELKTSLPTMEEMEAEFKDTD